MILVFGGAYNGKISWVMETFSLNKEDIYFCNDENIDFSKKVICGLHKFTYENSIKEVDSLEVLMRNKEKLDSKIIICDEISSGIVPLKKEERRWREDTGRCLQYLSKNSDKVYRVFCGIVTVVKDA